MTEVQKVSIGGYAFTLEVEAYNIVKQYLDELNEYYASREGGTEIMEGIEERMAELLYEKCADDGVASVAEVEDIIATLGKPSAIESEDDPQPKSFVDEASAKPKERKRFYRDPTNKILGGVCSGLSAYFKCDVVLVRIIFIGLWMLTGALSWHVGHGGWVFGWNIGSWMPILYIILWIAMPEARTVKQRWEMGVTNPPAGSQPVGSDLGRVLRVLIGCLLLIIGVSGLTFGIAAIFGYRLFDWNMLKDVYDEIAESAPSVLPMLGSVAYKIVLLLIYFLPMLGMVYGGIMMVFNLKSPSWRPGLVIFLLWVIALVVFIVLTIMGFFNAEIWT